MLEMRCKQGWERFELQLYEPPSRCSLEKHNLGIFTMGANTGACKLQGLRSKDVGWGPSAYLASWLWTGFVGIFFKDSNPNEILPWELDTKVDGTSIDAATELCQTKWTDADPEETYKTKPGVDIRWVSGDSLQGV